MEVLIGRSGLMSAEPLLSETLAIPIEEKYVGLVWRTRAIFDPRLRAQAERMRAGPHHPSMESVPPQVATLLEDAFRVGLSARLFRSAARVPFFDASGKSVPPWEASPFPALSFGPHLLAWCIDLYFEKPFRKTVTEDDPATALFHHYCAEWKAASSVGEREIARSPFAALHFGRSASPSTPTENAPLSAFARSDLRSYLFAVRGDLVSRWRTFLLRAVTKPVDEMSDSLKNWGAFFGALPEHLKNPSLTPFVPTLLLVMEGFLPHVEALATRTWESNRTLAARAVDRKNLATFFDAVVSMAEIRDRLRGVSFVDDGYETAKAALRYFDSPREDLFHRASFVSARLKEL